MTEWLPRGMGMGLKSDCGRFTLHSHAYGLFSLYDYGGEDWPERATLPDGRKTPQVSTFRSMEAAKRQAERRVERQREWDEAIAKKRRESQ